MFKHILNWSYISNKERAVMYNKKKVPLASAIILVVKKLF